MSDTPKFVDGLFVKAPHERAPDFVKCAISIKRKELGNWLRGQDEDWINLDVKVSRDGKWYAQINDWKPEQQSAPQQPAQSGGGMPDDFDGGDIPF